MKKVNVIMKRINEYINLSTLINLTVILAVFLFLNMLLVQEFLVPYYEIIFINILIAIILALSLNIATGFLGQLVLGHAGFMAIGAYAAALTAIALQDKIPSELLLYVVSLIVAMIFAGLAGVLVGTPALRLRGDYLGIMTLGFGQIVVVILENLEITGKSNGLRGIPTIINFPIVFWTTIIIVAIIVLFMKSRHGRAILSIREDEIASENVGINITKYKIIGFTMASSFGGVAGAIYAFHWGYISPTAFNFLKSIEIFVMVVLGGMGSITGSIISAAVLTYLPEQLRFIEDYRLLIYSVILVVVMLFRPKGLMGTSEFSYKGIYNWAVNAPKETKKTFKSFKEKIRNLFTRRSGE